jgi:hypothetical protein
MFARINQSSGKRVSTPSVSSSWTIPPSRVMQKNNDSPAPKGVKNHTLITVTKYKITVYDDQQKPHIVLRPSFFGNPFRTEAGV